MKVKELRLHLVIDVERQHVALLDQTYRELCRVYWGWKKHTKPQAIAIAKRLCDRFNAGQEKL